MIIKGWKPGLRANGPPGEGSFLCFIQGGGYPPAALWGAGRTHRFAPTLRRQAVRGRGARPCAPTDGKAINFSNYTILGS